MFYRFILLYYLNFLHCDFVYWNQHKIKRYSKNHKITRSQANPLCFPITIVNGGYNWSQNTPLIPHSLLITPSPNFKPDCLSFRNITTIQFNSNQLVYKGLLIGKNNGNQLTRLHECVFGAIDNWTWLDNYFIITTLQRVTLDSKYPEKPWIIPVIVAVNSITLEHSKSPLRISGW